MTTGKTYLALSVFLFLGLATAQQPILGQEEEGKCGDVCEACAGLHNYKVLPDDSEDPDYASTGGDCVFRSEGCPTMFPCGGGSEEDPDYQAVEVLAQALQSPNSAEFENSLAAYEPRLTLFRERNLAILFGGCSRKSVLAVIPVSGEVFDVLTVRGISSTELYLAGLDGDR